MQLFSFTANLNTLEGELRALKSNHLLWLSNFNNSSQNLSKKCPKTYTKVYI